MPEQVNPNQICPYLGIVEDRQSRFSFPEEAHRCYSKKQDVVISLEYQAKYCLCDAYTTCPRFVETTGSLISDESSTELVDDSSTEAPVGGLAPMRIALWGLAAILAISTIVYYVSTLSQQVGEFTAATPTGVATGPSPVSNSTTELLSAAEPEVTAQPTPTPPALATAPIPEITPLADGEIYELSPAETSVGWVANGEERGNHFGDSYLYAGVFEGQSYHSAFQIDLSSIPRGAPIEYAAIQLTGLREDRLGRGGVWSLRLLTPDIDEDWGQRNYQEIFNATTLHTLNPILGDLDLAVGNTNIFEFSSAQIKILAKRIADNEEPVISFRVDGPLIGADNLFAWDTGYGPQTKENKVKLVLNVGPEPATPPPFDFLVVTSTPTPQNVVTAAAIVMQMTAEATRLGTVTPLPANMVTATPFPDYLVIVPTPTPENEVTAQAMIVEATAIALTTGTPTPFPTDAVTATPTTPPTETPTPVPLQLVIITSTPTPDSVFTAATLSAAATAQARAVGTATPLPANWVTPIVVTATPQPLNAATAQAEAQLATAIALTTGTPEPTPSNVQTATPTAAFTLIEPILQPTLTPIPSRLPEAMPTELIGKILFLSDRELPTELQGTQNYPFSPGFSTALTALNSGLPDNKKIYVVYVFDPETGQLGRLTASWPYDLALARDSWSADNRFRVFTKDAIRYKQIDPTILGAEPIHLREDIPALYWSDSLYKAEEQLTEFGAGIAYQGAWSPMAEQITFVSTDSADDDIWIINRDGSGLKQLTEDNREYNAREIGKDTFIPEINKHPSFSPDGQQIVFFSTRSGNNQLWVMNRDGSEEQILMDWTPYNDWDPVWVKYSDAAPVLPSP